jgi:hypothetical protein
MQEFFTHNYNFWIDSASGLTTLGGTRTEGYQLVDPDFTSGIAPNNLWYIVTASKVPMFGVTHIAWANQRISTSAAARFALEAVSNCRSRLEYVHQVSCLVGWLDATQRTSPPPPNA